MLRLHKSRQGQAISAEYVIIFALILSVMAGMTIYLRRVLQARIRDAGYGMADMVQARTAGHNVDVIYRQYEPYYTNATTYVARDQYSQTRLLPSGVTKSSGIFRKEIDETSTVFSYSEVAPPKDAD